MKNPDYEYIYGINPAFELIRGQKRPVLEALINKSGLKNPRLKKLLVVLENQGIGPRFTDRNELFQLAQTKEHQGVVIKTSPYPYVDLNTLLDSKRLVLLDNIEDPHNMGSILRSAEIFGFKSIFLPTKGVPGIYPSVVKTSAGASEHLNICLQHTANKYMRIALENDYTVVALDAKGRFLLHEIPIPAKLLLVIGGEDKSVGQFILNQAHYVTAISQFGQISSLNASVAAGIAMYRLGQTFAGGN